MPCYTEMLSRIQKDTEKNKGEMMTWTEFVRAEGENVARERVRLKSVDMIPHRGLPPGHNIPYPEDQLFARETETLSKERTREHVEKSVSVAESTQTAHASFFTGRGGTIRPVGQFFTRPASQSTVQLVPVAGRPGRVS